MIAENAYVAATATAPVDPGGNPGNNPLAVNATNNGTVTINENGGILTAALRPTANWEINGSAEMLYADNAFTPMTPRQTRQYRVHTMYKPRPWAVISGSFNDVEHHNNTNNDQAAVTAKDVAYAGPLDHVDYSRVVGLGCLLYTSDEWICLRR